MTDIMVDVETTGTNAHCNAIIQIAAIKFNYETGEIGGHFDRCPMPMPFRGWNDSTRDWWMGKNRAVYLSIVARAEPGPVVFRDFFDWVNVDAPQEKGYRFWAKPVSFDFNFVASHMEQCSLPMPMHYRYARDLNTFLCGLSGTAEHTDVEDQVPFPAGGDAHNALHDVAWQIDQLMFAKKRHVRAEVV